MSTSGPPPHKMRRAEEETRGSCPYDEDGVVNTLMSHFNEEDFLEYTLGAFNKLKMKIQEVDLLVQLYEKELGVEKVRRFRIEVKVKLGLQDVSSVAKGNNSSSAPKMSRAGIQKSQGLSMPVTPGSVKPMKTKTKIERLISLVNARAATSMTAPMPKSGKSNEGEISMMIGAASTGLEKDECTANLGDGGTYPNKNVREKPSSRSNQPQKSEDGVAELEVIKRSVSMRNISEHKVSTLTTKNDKVGDGDLADSQAESELWQNVEDTPEKVLEQIQLRLRGGGTGGSVLKFTAIACRAIEMGSYKVTDYDADPLTAILTPLGIILDLPHSTSKAKIVNMCIPKKNIIILFANLLNDLDEKHPAISLKTDPIYATWLRDVLGMDGNPDDKNTNYYCPQKGCYGQQTIHFFVDSLSDFDKVFIKKVFADILKEVDYRNANTD